MTQKLEELYQFMMSMYGYVLLGTEPMEVAAITCEFPFTLTWDLDNETRKETIIVDPGTNRGHYPPHWHCLPAVVAAVAFGRLPQP